MKIAALIATLVLGSSSLALAEPTEYSGHGVVDRDQPQKFWHGPARLWRPLTQPTRLVAGQIVSPGKAAGPLNTLELTAVKGSSFVQSIGIQFAGGGHQVVTLDQTLDARNPKITIDLAGTNRTIKHIEIYGSSKPHSAYQILAV